MIALSISIALGLALFHVLGHDGQTMPCTVGVQLADRPMHIPHADMPWRPSRRHASMTCAVPLCDIATAYPSRDMAMAQGIALANWRLRIAGAGAPWTISARRTMAQLGNVAGHITVAARQVRDSRGRFTAAWAVDVSDITPWQGATL